MKLGKLSKEEERLIINHRKNKKRAKLELEIARHIAERASVTIEYLIDSGQGLSFSTYVDAICDGQDDKFGIHQDTYKMVKDVLNKVDEVSELYVQSVDIDDFSV